MKQECLLTSCISWVWVDAPAMVLYRQDIYSLAHTHPANLKIIFGSIFYSKKEKKRWGEGGNRKRKKLLHKRSKTPSGSWNTKTSVCTIYTHAQHTSFISIGYKWSIPNLQVSLGQWAGNLRAAELFSIVISSSRKDMLILFTAVQCKQQQHRKPPVLRIRP